MGTREDITRAILEGTEAGSRGDPPTVCPYRDVMRTAWIKGYASTAPSPTQGDDDA